MRLSERQARVLSAVEAGAVRTTSWGACFVESENVTGTCESLERRGLVVIDWPWASGQLVRPAVPVAVDPTDQKGATDE